MDEKPGGADRDLVRTIAVDTLTPNARRSMLY